MKLIDADVLMEIAYEHMDDTALAGLANALEKTPTAEKKGRWLMVAEADVDGNARYECSLCHAGETHTPKVKVSYCWNCGARMEE